MEQNKFEAIVKQELSEIKKLVVVKGEEYARNGDRLSNFKQAAGIRRGETPEGALLGMLIKHWTSIADLIDDISDGKVAPIEKWNEKVRDNIVYSLLLKASIIERLGLSVHTFTSHTQDDAGSAIEEISDDDHYSLKKSLKKMLAIANEYGDENEDWLSIRNEAMESLSILEQSKKKIQT